MKYLTKDGLVYLATVYSKHPNGIYAAFHDASYLAARLLTQGYKVYSPIAHTHPIAMSGQLDPYDHSIWMPFDEAMMNASEALLVATMPGWNESKGIAHEINYFSAQDKPIFKLDPKTLEITR